MNYRHHFHAGNYADVMKHALLVRLIRDLQKKERGFVYVDTHAGRGRYDLARARVGDSMTRKPEWPEGIGRLWSTASEEVPAPLRDYLSLVRAFDRRWQNLEDVPRFYPGSPWLACLLMRQVDRLALCEMNPAEFAALRAEFSRLPRVSMHEVDGYVALRAMLPPRERRALVLIDPPFEAQDEFALIVDALAEALRRFPRGVFAVWYPLTIRARVDEFLRAVRALNPPPALAAELTVAGEPSNLKMKGCGLLVINPPWQFDQETLPLLTFLARVLEHEPGGNGRIDWLVREHDAT